MSTVVMREKILWVVIILLVGFIGACVIYFSALSRGLPSSIGITLGITPTAVILFSRFNLIKKWEGETEFPFTETKI